jgi:hypothetical protein
VTGLARILWCGALLAVFACERDTLEPPRIEQVEPATGGRGTRVRILGSFPIEPYVSVHRRPDSPVVASYVGRLGAHVLDGLVRTDRGTLEATVPADLSLGTHALEIEGPTGTARLERAFSVSAPELGCRTSAADRINAFGGSGGATDTGLAAPVVLFQDDFTTNLPNRGGAVSALGVNGPYSLGGYVDPCNADATRFLVVDRSNHRVLVYDGVPHSADTEPMAVVGQTGFESGSANGGQASTNDVGLDEPVYASVCSDGKLFVADRNNNRVLGWYRVPESSGAAADFVLGQADFVASAPGGGATGFNQPYAAHCIDDRLVVVDKMNHRVLIYDAIPHSTGAQPELVIGQPDFNQNAAACTAAGLHEPYEVLLHGGRLYIADGANSRVLQYDAIPTTNGAAATAVIGQPDFVSCAVNRGITPSAATLNWPNALGVSDDSVLAVCDHFNDRVVFYSLPLTIGGNAFAQLGQPDLTTTGTVGPPTQGSIDGCKGLLFDGSYLWVAEVSNDRVQAIPLSY